MIRPGARVRALTDHLGHWRAGDVLLVHGNADQPDSYFVECPRHPATIANKHGVHFLNACDGGLSFGEDFEAAR